MIQVNHIFAATGLVAFLDPKVAFLKTSFSCRGLLIANKLGPKWLRFVPTYLSKKKRTGKSGKVCIYWGGLGQNATSQLRIKNIRKSENC